MLLLLLLLLVLLLLNAPPVEEEAIEAERELDRVREREWRRRVWWRKNEGGKEGGVSKWNQHFF